ncbi:MAG TPA: metalloregulator ArsR/SmtB family transcription factor [Candidatus Solibacter sp.]|nr:metalloregulator ArsR/SmtB family transcription factor [Candidatus Solibacter sp.]
MELQSYGTTLLDATFAALADPTRRAILARLAMGEASVAELAAPFDMTQPAISKHLRVLERAGLISSGRDAQRRPRRLEAQPLAQATEWLEHYRKFWEGRFQRLDSLLAEVQASAKPKRQAKVHRKIAAHLDRGKKQVPPRSAFGVARRNDISGGVRSRDQRLRDRQRTGLQSTDRSRSRRSHDQGEQK